MKFKKNTYEKYNINHSFFYLISNCILSQPVLTDSVNYKPNNDFTFYSGAYVNPGTSGANQNWNLPIIGTSDGVTTIGGAGSNPMTSITISNLNHPTNPNLLFFEGTSTEQYIEAEYAGPISMYRYSDYLDLLRFPFAYTNSFTDTYNGNTNQGLSTWYRRGSVTVTADGYGNLNTPSGAYNNVMRVHYLKNYIDSTYQNGGAILLNVTRDEFRWYKNGIYTPIAIVFSKTSNGTNTTGASYLSGFVGINDKNTNEIKFTTFPNPVNDKLNIFIEIENSNKVDIKIMDALGKCVREENLQLINRGANTFSLDTKELINGCYFVQIQSDKSTSAHKIIIAK